MKVYGAQAALLLTGENKIIVSVITVSAILLIVSSVLCGLRVIFHYIFISPNKEQNNPHFLPKWKQYQDNRETIYRLTDDLDGKEYEEVCITSREGFKLYGRYYHIADGAPLDIAFHGFRGTAVRDFCKGSVISFGLGHNLLLVDERAHGKSEGGFLTYGVKEKEDLKLWIDYSIERFGREVKIVLLGVSMGASIVLLANENDLPGNIKGILADSPYTSAKDIVRAVAKNRGLLPGLVYFLLNMSALVYGHFNLKNADVESAVRKAKIPIVICHGEADSLIPCEMSRKLKEANREMVQLEIFAGAEHAVGFITEQERY